MNNEQATASEAKAAEFAKVAKLARNDPRKREFYARLSEAVRKAATDRHAK